MQLQKTSEQRKRERESILCAQITNLATGFQHLRGFVGKKTDSAEQLPLKDLQLSMLHLLKKHYLLF